jgi:hypothetical protein
MTPALFVNVYEQLVGLTGKWRPRRGPLAVFVEQTMKASAEEQIMATILPRVRMGDLDVQDVSVQEIPQEWVSSPELVAHEASGHVIGGRVHLTADVVEKMRRSPLGGALQFRAGDRGDDPLRLSAICGIALALAQAPSARRAA